MRKLLPGIVCAMIELLVITGWDGLSTRSQRASSRAGFRAIFASLAVGQSSDQVGKVIQVEPSLRVIKEGRSWRLASRSEFGARNWIGYVEFDDSNLLKSAKVRTADSELEKPPASPPDLE